MAPLKRVILGLASSAAALVAGCAVQFSASDEYAERFAPGDATFVVFEGVEGDVVARGMEIADVQVNGTRSAVGATRREARRRLGGIGLDASREAGALVLSFNPKLEDEGLVDLTLDRVSTLPSVMGIGVDLEFGDVELSDIGGAMDIQTGAGDIEIEDSTEDAAVDATTDEGYIAYALTSWDELLFPFRIECVVGEDGEVLLDSDLEALVDSSDVQRTEANGAVVISFHADDSATKRVRLTANGGNISLVLSNDIEPLIP